MNEIDFNFEVKLGLVSVIGTFTPNLKVYAVSCWLLNQIFVLTRVLQIPTV